MTRSTNNAFSVNFCTLTGRAKEPIVTTNSNQYTNKPAPARTHALSAEVRTEKMVAHSKSSAATYPPLVGLEATRARDKSNKIRSVGI